MREEVPVSSETREQLMQIIGDLSTETRAGLVQKFDELNQLLGGKMPATTSDEKILCILVEIDSMRKQEAIQAFINGPESDTCASHLEERPLHRPMRLLSWKKDPFGPTPY
jgi:hypothetical protein